jgi:hypothetical protein
MKFFGLDPDPFMNRIGLLLAVAGLALLVWGWWLQYKGRGSEQKLFRDRALALLGVLGALLYCNFGYLHFGNFIHTWDTYHYYVGSKYFPELGYDLLYDCTAVADREDAEGSHDQRLLARVERRVLTDLRTNVMVPSTYILSHPEVCKSHFAPDRWLEFRHDIAWFRARVYGDKWEDIQKDHGYNATPVWNLVGHLLSSTGAASDDQVIALNLLDPLYLAAMAVLIFWAFGWRVTAVALLAWGTDFPSRYYWTGGAFLRHDWLFFLVACICLLKKQKWYLAGAAISYSTLLRLFPGFVILGPIIGAGDLLWQLRGMVFKKAAPSTEEGQARLAAARDKLKGYVQFFAGGVVAALLLVSLSIPSSGGIDAWRRFAQNTTKHANTPLTNHMGLRTVVSWRPSMVGRYTRDGRLTDPWSVWKQGRLDNYAHSKPLFALIFLGFCVLLYYCVRGSNHELWVAAAASTGMIAVGAELTCYYYCFVAGIATLFAKRREAGIALLAYCAITQFVALAPFTGMTGWLDEQYMFMSVAALIAFGAIMWLFSEQGSKQCVAPEDIALAGGGTVERAERRRREREEQKERKRKRKRA